MRRLISHGQYRELLAMRQDIARAILHGNSVATQHGIGMAQGYLLGLRAAGEIDDDIMTALEAETFSGVDFMLNARRGANAHASQ